MIFCPLGFFFTQLDHHHVLLGKLHRGHLLRRGCGHLRPECTLEAAKVPYDTENAQEIPGEISG